MRVATGEPVSVGLLKYAPARPLEVSSTRSSRDSTANRAARAMGEAGETGSVAILFFARRVRNMKDLEEGTETDKRKRSSWFDAASREVRRRAADYAP